MPIIIISSRLILIFEPLSELAPQGHRLFDGLTVHDFVPGFVHSRCRRAFVGKWTKESPVKRPELISTGADANGLDLLAVELPECF